jgi:hypothetical protein
MMIVQRVPQSGGAAGVFLAVDAEPDGTVGAESLISAYFNLTPSTAGFPLAFRSSVDTSEEEVSRIAIIDLSSRFRS